MERFWTLKYLQQNGITELEASFFKENLVRADTLPLVLPVMGGQNLPRGARVRVKLGEMDLITLDISGTVIERLDTPVTEQGVADNADEDDEEVSGPIAIAVDVSEPTDTADAPNQNPSP
jgi:exoribonuclease-2